MTKQVTFSVAESMKKLKKSLDDLAPAIEERVNQAVKDVAYAAFASITAKAQKELGRTRQDYLKGLEILDLGDNNYVISLEGKYPNDLEGGYPSFNMTPGMLASNKIVQVGRRKGQPWVQHSKPKGKNKESHKYAFVPMPIQPHSKAAKTSNLADALKSLTALNKQGMDQAITKIFRDSDGKVQEGPVAVIRGEGVVSNQNTPYSIGNTNDERLKGLVKYQKIQRGPDGKETVQSIYMRYRAVSEKGKPWIHPGFKGLHAFPEAEKDIARHIDEIVKALVK